MRLSDLQGKDIVDISDGKRVGNIIDIVITRDGNIETLMVERKKALSMFSQSGEIEVKWKQVDKIGEDVILVKLN